MKFYVSNSKKRELRNILLRSYTIMVYTIIGMGRILDFAGYPAILISDIRPNRLFKRKVFFRVYRQLIVPTKEQKLLEETLKDIFYFFAGYIRIRPLGSRLKNQILETNFVAYPVGAVKGNNGVALNDIIFWKKPHKL